MFNSQTGFMSNFVEQDGCARTVIVLLMLTTVGCISYTWGYYEGIANAQSNLMLDKLHELQLMQMSTASNGTEAQKHVMGHGMRLAEAYDTNRIEEVDGTHEPAVADVDTSATKAAAALEEATTGSQRRLASDQTVGQLRGVSGTEERKASRKLGIGRHGEEET